MVNFFKVCQYEWSTHNTEYYFLLYQCSSDRLYINYYPSSLDYCWMSQLNSTQTGMNTAIDLKVTFKNQIYALEADISVACFPKTARRIIKGRENLAAQP
jgi:hypothetical protein